MTARPDLLRIRLNELREDMAQVTKIVETAARRQQRVSQLLHMGADISTGLAGARKMLIDLADEMSRNDEVSEALDGFEIPRSVEKRLGKDWPDPDGPRWLAAFTSLLADVHEDIITMGRSLDDLNQAMIALGDTEEINGRCNRIDGLVAGMQTDLLKGVKTRATLWSEMEVLLDTDGRAVFVDYVDMLAGLTLRDNGLDDRISELTDALIKELDVATTLRAVPARPADISDAATRPLPGSLVKLWFPEWAIWDVPLLGYDAGVHWSHTSSAARELLAAESERPGARSLVAHAYAAYALGPAYACAAVLLRVRPPAGTVRPADGPTTEPDGARGRTPPSVRPAGRAPTGDEAPEADRVQVILTVLRSLSDGGTYGALIDVVDQCWQAAVRERDGAVEPADPASLARYTTHILGSLRNLATPSAFGPKLWEEEARGPYTALTSGSRSEGPTGIRPTVRGLLNAAWAVWLERSGDPASGAEIAQAAKRMWTPRRRSAVASRGGNRSRGTSTARKTGHGTLG
ncbi:hypothetical protein [Actinoplanes sp. NPDC051851]|uniref:hypothetical protein n=1 Tax=Actinoplanes sp. NPDC051851 TaxID=3154753 RepID=UPI0034260593